MADYCNDVIDEFLEDMGNLTDNFDDLSTGSDNDFRAENRRAKKRRLFPFYRTRKAELKRATRELELKLKSSLIL